ncbi:hypothetical protein V1478_002598 [Vespula squamosa]|uniref:Transposase n=1 Tax=Vespula squamosa TaxID=30214 RepID=A0ABD2BTI3_VESSQ
MHLRGIKTRHRPNSSNRQQNRGPEGSNVIMENIRLKRNNDSSCFKKRYAHAIYTRFSQLQNKKDKQLLAILLKGNAFRGLTL